MEWSKIKNVIKLCLIKGVMEQDVVTPFCNSAGMPEAAAHAAKLLWINKVPEDKNTKLLRKQLTSLQITGMFDLK